MDAETNIDEALDFFHHALRYSLLNHPDEVRWARGLSKITIRPNMFLGEYIWVVLVSGFSAKGARSIEERLYGDDGRLHFDEIRNKGKRNAIERASREYREWFNVFNGKGSDMEKLEFLETLPFIGPITKYHLAKNLGMEVAKPDRHLQRLADRWGFEDVQEMCRVISIRQGHSIVVVDQVLWRYCADRQPVEVHGE